MEDDYMSDDFLVAAEAAKTTGLATTVNGKRLLKMERMRSDNEEIHKKKPKREEVEKERREEALNKPVCESTKGFAMLAKMGYKPGMSLGKKKDENDLGSGIKEPLPLEVRMGRKGFGHDYDLVQKRRQTTTRIKAEMDKMKNNADRHDEILEDFRRRKKNNTVTRKLISDIVNCRKTCMDLDIRQGITRPQKPWFWKSYTQKDDSVGPSHKDPDDLVWTYGNGEPAEREERLDELTEDELTDRLLEIVDYLRSRHLYCIWCGHVYSSSDDLSTNCSGPLSEDHDDQVF